MKFYESININNTITLKKCFTKYKIKIEFSAVKLFNRKTG